MTNRCGWESMARSPNCSSGFTLVETIVAMAVLFIAMAGVITANLSSMHLRQLNAQEAKARNAAEGVLSAIRGTPNLVEAYNRFGGGGPEERFDVRGLQGSLPGEPAGRVIVWRLKSSLKDRVNPPQPDPGSPFALSKTDILAAQARFSSSFPNVMDSVANTDGTGWNDYLDTNTDGKVDSTDDPQLMGVSVRIRWRTSSGLSTQYFSAVIGKR